MTNRLLNKEALSGAVRGAGFIEVLIALLLIGITLSAIFASNHQSLKLVRQTQQSEFVLNQLQSLGTRIQLNAGARDVYETTGSGTTNINNCSNNCSPDVLAEQDLYVWSRLLAQQLPDFDFAIDITDESAVMSVYWPGAGLDNFGIPSDCLANGNNQTGVCITLAVSFLGDS